MLTDITQANNDTAFVCHDAGAANIVIAGLRNKTRSDLRAFMRGPAEKIWNDVFPDVSLCESLATALDNADVLVSGTGWGSDLEHQARKLARLHGVYSIAVIDHWVNYAGRFIRKGETEWPDEFWVTDEYALDISRKVFPGKKICLVPNHYMINFLAEVARFERVKEPELLYVLEPARNDWGRGVPGEFQALDFFVSHMPDMGFPPDTRIMLRPHPSDFPGKYEEWISRHPDLNLKVVDSVGLAESVGRARWLVGCESYALVLGIMAGRRCFCTLPPWAPACRLPHPELVSIADEFG